MRMPITVTAIVGCGTFKNRRHSSQFAAFSGTAVGSTGRYRNWATPGGRLSGKKTDKGINLSLISYTGSERNCGVATENARIKVVLLLYLTLFIYFYMCKMDTTNANRQTFWNTQLQSPLNTIWNALLMTNPFLYTPLWNLTISIRKN